MDGQGGRGGHKLTACCSWDIFEESAKDHGEKLINYKIMKVLTFEGLELSWVWIVISNSAHPIDSILYQTKGLLVAIMWLQFICDCNHGVLKQTSVIVGGHYLAIVLSMWSLKNGHFGFLNKTKIYMVSISTCVCLWDTHEILQDW